MDTADQKVERRAVIESDYNGERDQLEKSYTSQKASLEASYQSALKSIDDRKRAALEEAGLNPDGSDPQHNDRTPPEYHQQPAQILAN